tara:strand:- start:89 stop:271 length:183 start_codon:yes stop_codon:yes gene_type:complete
MRLRKTVYFFETKTLKGKQRYSDFFECEELANKWNENYIKKAAKFTNRILTLNFKLKLDE